MREVLIWLSGLLSTDGTVDKLRFPTGRQGTGSGTYYSISSMERDWLEQVQAILKEVGISCKITLSNKGLSGERSYKLYVHNPKLITKLLVDNDLGRFIMTRKWERILEAYQYYFKTFRPQKQWTRAEEQMLIDYFKNHIKTWKNVWEAPRGKKARPAPIFQALSKKLNRTPMAIIQKCYKLRLHER